MNNFQAICDTRYCTIAAIEPRLVCESCEEITVCKVCNIERCPRCDRKLYCDKAANHVLLEHMKGKERASELLKEAFDVYAERPFLRAAKDSHFRTYAQVSEDARVIGKWLDTFEGAIALAAENCIEWVLCDLGCALFDIPTIACDPDDEDLFESAKNAANVVGLRVSLILANDDASTEPEHSIPLAPMRANVAKALQNVSFLRRSVATQKKGDFVTCLFSSGTTGRPKPLWFTAKEWLHVPSVSFGRSRVCVCSPLFHGLGRRQLWRELAWGGTVVLATAGAIGSDLLNEIAEARPTSISAVPRFWSLVRDLIKNEDLASARKRWFPCVQYVGIGGAVVDFSLYSFVEDLLGIGGAGGGNGIISDTYGCTELGGIAHNGMLLRGVQVKLDADTSEILVKKASQNAAFGSQVDSEGWYRTGDVGEFKGEKLCVIDRLGAGVKLENGKFVSPARLEAKLESFSKSIIECAVSLKPGDPAPDACVCLVVSSDITSDYIRKELNGKLKPYELPRRFVLISQSEEKALLRTASGKLRRNAVLKRFLGHDVDENKNDDLVASIYSQLHDSLFTYSPEETLSAIGIDSVAVARLFELDRDVYTAESLRPADLLKATLGDLSAFFSKDHFGPLRTQEVSWEDEVNSSDALAIESCVTTATGPSTEVLVGPNGFLGTELMRCLRSSSEHLVLLSRSAASTKSYYIDLARSDLGLSKDAYSGLRSLRVVRLIISAAMVDHLRTYEELKSINVSAIDRLLELFSLSMPHVIFVSSVAAVLPKGGYGRSKWVAEQRLQRQVGRQCSGVSVARLGLLGFPISCARRNDDDWIHLLIRAIVRVRASPRVCPDAALHLLPVDIAAQSVLALPTIPSFAVNRIDASSLGFAPVAWHDLLNALRLAAKKRAISDEMSSFTEISYTTWRDKIFATDCAAILSILPSTSSSSGDSEEKQSLLRLPGQLSLTALKMSITANKAAYSTHVLEAWANSCISAYS